MLRFLPIYKQRVWGGRKIGEHLYRTLPDGCIGESWDIVDRPENQSLVTQGPMAHLSLREIREQHADTVLGPDYPREKPFPILVKWLDCRERLSLQVHPTPQDPEGEPKTEFWYIAAAQPGAAVFAGLQAKVTRKQFQEALHNNTIESLVPRLQVKAGNALLVESGCPHAIDAGNLILEIQQNSDTTYRVWDWDRLGLDGKPRELHTDRSLQAIDFHAETPVIQQSESEPDNTTLADCNWFRIRKKSLNANCPSLSFQAGEQPRLLHVISGVLTGSLTFIF